MARRDENRPILKTSPSLKPAFDAVQADPVATPALTEQKRLKNDISIMAIGSTERSLAMRLSNRDGEDSPEARQRREDREYARDISIAQEYARIARTIEGIDRQIEDIDRQITDNFAQQKQLETFIARNNERLHALAEENTSLLEEKKQIETEIKETEHESKAAADQAENARTHFEKKLKEIYPDGEPGYGKPDPIADKEKALADAAYAKHHDKVAERYKKAGLEQEFLILDRMRSGEKIDEAIMNKTFASVAKANMPVDPDAVMFKIMRKENPSDPYMDTLHAARAGITAAHHDTIRINEKVADLERRHVRERLEKIEERLKTNEQEMKDIADKNASAEKQLAQLKDAMTKLQDDREKLTKQREQAVAYQQWLDDPKTKDAIRTGNISQEDIKKQTPKFMAEGYIDDGGYCVNPNSKRGAALAKTMEMQASAEAQAARPDLSAADTAISADKVTGSFNASANNTAANASTAPVPLTPERKAQAPRSSTGKCIETTEKSISFSPLAPPSAIP